MSTDIQKKYDVDELAREEEGKDIYFLFLHFSNAKSVARNIVAKNKNAIPYNLSIRNKVKLTFTLFKHA